MNLDTLKAQLVRHEGMELKVYRDSIGIPTIGVGRNLQDVGISEAEALMLLDHDVSGVIDDLDREVPWWRNMSENRQLVIADMCFNLGIVKLKSFRKALDAMQNGRWSDASREMLDSRWAKQVGSRALTLYAMMENG